MEDGPITEEERSQATAKLEAIQAIQGEMGWKWFMAEIENEITVIVEDLKICDPEHLGRLQGRYDAFSQIIHFEDIIDNTLASLADPDVGED